MPQIFVFTAGNTEARQHLHDSIQNPIDDEVVFGCFAETYQEDLEKVRSDGNGFYAWGAVPGDRNKPTWEAMEPGDYVLCVYDSTYHYIARILAKYDNRELAEVVWGHDKEGRTWQYMYFLTEPMEVDLALAKLQDYLYRRYQGFTRISDERLDAIVNEYGSIEEFADLVFGFQGGRTEDLEETLATVLSWVENLDTRASPDGKFHYKPLLLLAVLDILDAYPDHGNRFEYNELRDAFTRLAAARGSAMTEPQFSQPYFNMRRDTIPAQAEQVWCLTATVDSESLDRIRGDNPARVRSAAPSAFINPDLWLAFESRRGRNRIRQKIDEVYGISVEDGGEQMLDQRPMNVILYGPPGTGKTYSVQRRALEILNPSLAGAPDPEVSAMYRQYLAEGRIEFVTFHPSYSYEEFVEGYRYDHEMGIPTLHEGVFQRLVNRAVNPRQSASSAGGARIWKVSLGRPSETEILRRCIENNEIAIGWFNDRDLTGYDKEDITELFREHDGNVRASNSINSVNYLVNGIREGDYVVVFRNQREIQAIGIVTGEYRYKGEEYDGLRHIRPVEWLDKEVHDIYELNGSTNLTRSTIYPLDRISLQDFVALLPDKQKAEEPYVLVIDEINRGNLSRIFGELITLLEPDKRRGAQNELAVRLPYSQRLFTVPSNLYVIGTMNTADRSIALIDVALRRRFEFEEMMPNVDKIRDRLSGRAGPQPDVELNAEQVDLLCHVFDVLNRRIIVLLDRDHQIGHSYFLDAVSMDRLQHILYRRVFPLLQEYFYNDRERLQRVLGAYSPTGLKGFVVGMDAEYQGIFGDGDASDDMPWEFHEYPVEELEAALRNTFLVS